MRLLAPFLLLPACDGSTFSSSDPCPALVSYADRDGDGFGDADERHEGCDVPVGFVANAEDCDDADAGIRPDATEVCDNVDNDCTGGIDDGLTFVDYFADRDGDGFAAEPAVSSCTPLEGMSTVADDCDDADDTVFPGAAEACDGIDQACDGIGEHAVPSVYAAVQDAIDAAVDGDWICIADGTYSGHLSVDKSLRIVGQSRLTILDGLSKSRVMTLGSAAADVTLEHLTIRHGLANEGAGLHRGGPDTTTTLWDVALVDNRCSSGNCTGVGAYLEGTVQLTDVDVVDNHAESTPSASIVGVGMAMHDGTLWADGVAFRGNVGVAAETITLYAAGLDLARSPFTMTDVVFEDNALLGGQVRATAMSVGTGSPGTMDRVDFYRNTGYAEAYSAGATLMVGSDVTLRNGIFAYNEIDVDPGLFTLATLIQAWGGSTTDVQFTTFAHNVNGAGGAHIAGISASPVNLSHTIAFDCAGSGPAYSGNGDLGTIDYSLFTSCGTVPAAVSAGDGNLVGPDPEFHASKLLDFTLDKGSAAIDAGDASLTDLDGTTADLGAHGGPGR